jgi:hypothetical protein
MGLSWEVREEITLFPAEPGQPWPVVGPGPRHRRPTRLARSGQALAGRLAGRRALAPRPRPASRYPTRIYWT